MVVLCFYVGFTQNCTFFFQGAREESLHLLRRFYKVSEHTPRHTVTHSETHSRMPYTSVSVRPTNTFLSYTPYSAYIHKIVVFFIVERKL